MFGRDSPVYKADPTQILLLLLLLLLLEQARPATTNTAKKQLRRLSQLNSTQLTKPILLKESFSVKMEARRRLALLSSHLRPIIPSTASVFSPNPTLEPFSVVSSSSLDGEKGTQETDCVFCKIIRGESPAFKLYEDDICLCILDRNPVSYGHSLIIPKSHFSSLRATPPSAVGAMCSKVPFISNAVMKATGCDSFNLLVNNGAAAGQVIFHTHLHIIPRKARDCLWTSESLPRRPLKLDQETSGLADQIRKELSFSDNSEYSKGQGSSLFVN